MKGNEKKLKEMKGSYSSLAQAPLWQLSQKLQVYHHHRHHQEEERGTQRKIENLFVNFLVIFSFKILFKKTIFLCLSGPPHTKAHAAKTIAPGKNGKKIAPGKKRYN